MLLRQSRCDMLWGRCLLVRTALIAILFLTTFVQASLTDWPADPSDDDMAEVVIAIEGADSTTSGLVSLHAGWLYDELDVLVGNPSDQPFCWAACSTLGWPPSVDIEGVLWPGQCQFFRVGSDHSSVIMGEAEREAFGDAVWARRNPEVPFSCGYEVHPYGDVVAVLWSYGPCNATFLNIDSFVDCMGGPGIPYAGPSEMYPEGCSGADLDGDGDVDLRDYGAFQRAIQDSGGPFLLLWEDRALTAGEGRSKIGD